MHHTIISSSLDVDVEICKRLQSTLLAFWRGEHRYCKGPFKLMISSVAFELVEEVIKHRINRFQDRMMDSELISMGLQVKGTPMI